MRLTGQISFLSGTPIMDFGTRVLTLWATSLTGLSYDRGTNRSILLPLLLVDGKSRQIEWDQNTFCLGVLCFYDMLVLHRLSFASLGCFYSYQVNE
ncbi:hypothetical protein KDK_69540 [Dictyobacter kobayashii]|uniref:Uncharacterized protein n=1 Tax=Dictyobacter kobayashii TaxID=2014872 RepID=A0A402AVP8_9CHLR|nr:hypothetical protein KDK_69540 [Dictyobacter kobayashii]